MPVKKSVGTPHDCDTSPTQTQPITKLYIHTQYTYIHTRMYTQVEILKIDYFFHLLLLSSLAAQAPSLQCTDTTSLGSRFRGNPRDLVFMFYRVLTNGLYGCVPLI